MDDDTLRRYRESIDNIDAALVFMLAERFKVTQAVGRLQGARPACPPADPGREGGRSRGCAGSPKRPISIRTFPRNSCASSSTK